jgi:hypothetical protein
MPKQLKPEIQRNPMPTGPTAGPPAKIIENPPASSVGEALSNAKKQVNAAK